MYTHTDIMIVKGVIFIEDDKVKSEKKFNMNPKLLFFLIIACTLIATFLISFYGYSSYIKYKNKESDDNDSSIRIVDTTVVVNSY